ncbi:hypothetical protein HDU93_000659 [Gonapodya sp. JEL0774]|nr:hypothetical protein HDU93_000659 [Gonapodya sp. JEL0774]
MELQPSSKQGSSDSVDQVPSAPAVAPAAPKPGWLASFWASSSPQAAPAPPARSKTPTETPPALPSRRSKSMPGSGADVKPFLGFAAANTVPAEGEPADTVSRSRSTNKEGHSSSYDYAQSFAGDGVRADPPELTIRWFHATDVPLRDDSPFKLLSANPPAARVEPQQWLSFSARDNREIEARYQEWLAHGGREAEERRGRKREREREQESAREKAKEEASLSQQSSEVELQGLEALSQGAGVDSLETEKIESSGRFKVSVGEDLLFEVDLELREMTPVYGNYAVFVGQTRALVMADSAVVSALVSALVAVARDPSSVSVAGVQPVVRGYDEAARQIKGFKEKEVAPKPVPDGAGASAPVSGDAKEDAANMEEKDYTDDELQERKVDHLIFVLHGIGQKMGEASSAVNFVHDCNQMRRAIKNASKIVNIAAAERDRVAPKKNDTTGLNNRVAGDSSTPQPTDQSALATLPPGSGVQVLPVLWRPLVDFGIRRTAGSASLDDVSLDSVPILRLLTKNFVTDLMLYTEPHHRRQLIGAVVRELKRIYTLYLARHPDQPPPRVSLVGHSLGSQLAMDILAGQPEEGDERASPPSLEGTDLSSLTKSVPAWSDLTTPPPGALIGSDGKIEVEKLPFEVENFFAIGSPIGFFLVLKNQKLFPRVPPSQSRPDDPAPDDFRYVRPRCKVMYNLYTPADMVAHKVEPTVDESLTANKPLSIPYTKGGIQGSINAVAQSWSQVRQWSAMIPVQLASLAVSRVAGLKTSTTGDAIGKMEASTAGKGTEGAKLRSASVVPPRTPKDILYLLNPRYGRLDFAQQEDMLQPEMLAALQAHFLYFSDPDIASFILGELYKPFIKDTLQFSFDIEFKLNELAQEGKQSGGTVGAVDSLTGERREMEEGEDMEGGELDADSMYSEDAESESGSELDSDAEGDEDRGESGSESEWSARGEREDEEQREAVEDDDEHDVDDEHEPDPGKGGKAQDGELGLGEYRNVNKHPRWSNGRRDGQTEAQELRQRHRPHRPSNPSRSTTSSTLGSLEEANEYGTAQKAAKKRGNGARPEHLAFALLSVPSLARAARASLLLCLLTLLLIAALSTAARAAAGPRVAPALADAVVYGHLLARAGGGSGSRVWDRAKLAATGHEPPPGPPPGRPGPASWALWIAFLVIDAVVKPAPKTSFQELAGAHCLGYGAYGAMRDVCAAVLEMRGERFGGTGGAGLQEEDQVTKEREREEIKRDRERTRDRERQSGKPGKRESANAKRRRAAAATTTGNNVEDPDDWEEDSQGGSGGLPTGDDQHQQHHLRQQHLHPSSPSQPGFGSTVSPPPVPLNFYDPLDRFDLVVRRIESDRVELAFFCPESLQESLRAGLRARARKTAVNSASSSGTSTPGAGDDNNHSPSHQLLRLGPGIEISTADVTVRIDGLSWDRSRWFAVSHSYPRRRARRAAEEDDEWVDVLVWGLDSKREVEIAVGLRGFWSSGMRAVTTKRGDFFGSSSITALPPFIAVEEDGTLRYILPKPKPQLSGDLPSAMEERPSSSPVVGPTVTPSRTATPPVSSSVPSPSQSAAVDDLVLAARLRYLTDALTAERDLKAKLQAQLKRARRDGLRILNQLRADIEGLTKSNARDEQADQRNRKRVQVLIEQADVFKSTVEDLEVELRRAREERKAAETESESAAREVTSVKEAIKKAEKGARQAGAGKQRLVHDAEEKLRQARKEREAVEAQVERAAKKEAGLGAEEVLLERRIEEEKRKVDDLRIQRMVEAAVGVVIGDETVGAKIVAARMTSATPPSVPAGGRRGSVGNHGSDAGSSTLSVDFDHDERLSIATPSTRYSPAQRVSPPITNPFTSPSADMSVGVPPLPPHKPNPLASEFAAFRASRRPSLGNLGVTVSPGIPANTPRILPPRPASVSPEHAQGYRQFFGNMGSNQSRAVLRPAPPAGVTGYGDLLGYGGNVPEPALATSNSHGALEDISTTQYSSRELPPLAQHLPSYAAASMFTDVAGDLDDAAIVGTEGWWKAFGQ